MVDLKYRYDEQLGDEAMVEGMLRAAGCKAHFEVLGEEGWLDLEEVEEEEWEEEGEEGEGFEGNEEEEEEEQEEEEG